MQAIITRELQAVTFLLACNIFTVQARNFNDGNTLRQSGCNLLSRQEEKCFANSTSYSHHSTKHYKRHVAIEAQAKTLEEAQ